MQSCHFDDFETAREKYTFKNMSSLKEEKALSLAEEEVILTLVFFNFWFLKLFIQTKKSYKEIKQKVLANF